MAVNPVVESPETALVELEMASEMMNPGGERPGYIDPGTVFTTVTGAGNAEASTLAHVVNTLDGDVPAVQYVAQVHSAAGPLVGILGQTLLEKLLNLNWGKTFVYYRDVPLGWLPVDIGVEWRHSLRPSVRRQVRLRHEGQGTGGRRHQGSGNTRPPEGNDIGDVGDIIGGVWDNISPWIDPFLPGDQTPALPSGSNPSGIDLWPFW